MRDALSQLGYKVTGVFGQDQSLKQLRETYVGQGLEIAQNFDAVEDMPWALMFRDLDKAFPSSKLMIKRSSGRSEKYAITSALCAS